MDGGATANSGGRANFFCVMGTLVAAIGQAQLECPIRIATTSTRSSPALLAARGLPACAAVFAGSGNGYHGSTFSVRIPVTVLLIRPQHRSGASPANCCRKQWLSGPNQRAVFLAAPLTHPAPDARAGVAFELVPRHANFNLPDWRHERWFFLNDPGEAKRREAACALGRSSWVVVSATAESVDVQSRGETGPCPLSRP